MTSTQGFNCIFCKESFENKDDLQIHFRKHGDPKFNQSVKCNKIRLANESQVADKAGEENEVVNCDVCSEVFPTISKAITHKHKAHPDHDAKYFCPWCGKLFTMKHLYNKHIQNNHNNEDSEEMGFHCDYCEVDFFVPSAMVYHNKFFHRQDTELAVIGHSKKHKLFNQEPLQLYYCPFCGEEYYNKVNLHKHMGDDHSDENQSPDDVLRCPLCEAIFYHLDAYELHLTFHSSNDMYNEENEKMNDLTEFSLETVPPIMEKVENDAQDDAETAMKCIGIEEFLQQAMNETNDSNSESLPEKKSKKHKKHKKKKAAITLDEFLNMNKDVFGEGIDFEGIEEVPTQVVAKQLKRKPPQKKQTRKNIASSAQLKKLQKAGIVVKMNPVKNTSLKGVKVGKPNPVGRPINAAQNVVSNKVKLAAQVTVDTPGEVLTKLLNQSNSQIKIIKKSNPDNLYSEEKKAPQSDTNKEETGDSTAEDHKNVHDSDVDMPSDNTRNNDHDTLESIALKSSEYCDSVKNDSVKAPASETQSTETGKEDNRAYFKKVAIENGCDNGMLNVSENANVEKGGSNITNTLRNLGQHITIKSLSSPNVRSEKSESNTDIDKHVESDIDDDFKTASEIVQPGETKDHNINENNETREPSCHRNSLNALKHLSHLITVKSVSQPKNTVLQTIAKEDSDENQPELKARSEKESSNKADAPETPTSIRTKNATSEEKSQDKIEIPKLDALKKLSNNITIKPLIQNKGNVITDSCGGHDEDEKDCDDRNIDTGVEINKSNKSKIEYNINHNSNITNQLMKNKIIKNFKSPDVRSLPVPQSPKTTSKLTVTNKSPKLEEEMDNPKFCDKDQSIIKNQSCSNILKHLPNVTAKPVTTMKKVSHQTIVKSSAKTITPQKNIIQKCVKKDQTKEEIEIFNIEDSDDEAERQSMNKVNNTPVAIPPKPLENKNAVSKSMDALKNLSKHITIKSTNQQQHEDLPSSDDMLDDISHDNAHSDESSNDVNSAQNCRPKPVDHKRLALQQTLKNLSKHIVVKPGNASPNIHVKLENPQQNVYKNKVHMDDTDSDSNSYTDNVKITEVTEENNSDDDMETELNQNHNKFNKNVIVQSPHDSNSENEDDGEQISDFETKIKLNALKKPTYDSKPSKQPPCLDNLRNISRNLTIKSFQENNSDEDEFETDDFQQQDIPDLPNRSGISIKPFKSVKPGCRNVNDTTTGKPGWQATGSRIHPSMNQTLAKVGQVNTLNKEVTQTVKTFQTQTVIEEVTTTVTKTIRTVNQTVKQEVKNMCQTQQTAIPLMRPQKVQGMRPHLRPSFQGIAVRQAPPNMGPRIRNPAVPVRPALGVVRPSNQLVPVRPGLNITRPKNPRMPVMRKVASSANIQQKPVIGRPLKISPNAMMPSTKRGNSEDSSGHFSCFKKPKESLIPVPDVPSFSNQSDAAMQFASSSHMSKYNVTSTTKTIQGNSLVTSTHMKSEVNASSSQVSRLSNMSGLKVVKTSQKQASQVEEKSENSASKRTTLAAIEKLQKQGLLVKKPRTEENYSEYSNSDDDYET